ncbi:MAG: AEC family transporter [Lachnospiraceae bacterium]|nr:AEC family transporter [Lachnospiraceae bacterium]
MDGFLSTLGAVAMMLGYASIGLALLKTKLIKEDGIGAFAKLLMYVSAPCLTIYTITDMEFSVALVKDAVIVLVFSMCIQAGLLLLFRFIYRKKKEDINYRIYNIATGMGNAGFMAVPLLEVVMPEYPEAVLLSTIYCLGMNFIGWTLTSYIISNDKSYMRIRNALLNPSTLSLVVALPLFISGVKMPSQLDTMVTLLGKMSAPLCMIIMGMRLGTMKFASLFTDKMVYFTIAIKQLCMPTLAFFVLKLLPVSVDFRKTVFILTAAPVASMVLNYAELIGQGQKKAANTVLLGTMLSILTMPVMVLLMYG